MKLDKSQIKYPDLLSKPNLSVWISTFINDEMIRHQQAQSLVANFLQWLYCRWSYADSTNWVTGESPFTVLNSLVDTNGTNRNMYLQSEQNCASPIGNDLFGICIGTGTTAPAPNDLITETKILHGSTSGKMQYSAMQGIQGIGMSGQISTFIIRRTFTNASGATINVSEVTLLMKAASYNYLLLRDVFNPADEVLNTKLYRIDLTFSIET